uniref:hypothetical protein RF1 n=1 Tax=Adiantum malesianum TaxID=451080 RepID=UPI00201DCF7D|nr:hypothetical protein RF1 [Adiantum malesianum]UPV69579.1 hypothetical protein RF1 [Adiantum malesianum]
MKKAATNINLLSSLPWLKLMSPRMLLGLYYGLLTTLPVGPSQILCVRSFLLGGNLSGLVSLSGSVFAQLVTISSIYCSPIYLFLLRPHLLTVVAIPYTLFFCLIIKDFPNYQILRPVTSLRDSRIARLFLINFLFQILNPIMLPNPVLTRLIYLYLFRYSTDTVFMVASFMGWLTGQSAFHYFSRLLLNRVKRDSPMLYLVAKRSIYTTFSIVFVSYAIAYLGRAPVSFWTKKFMNESHDREMDFWEIADYSDLLWWFFKPWPTSFFDPSRSNRSNRFVKNCRSDINSSFYKGRTSTYFFDRCLTDGKERLSFTTLPSLSIFEKWSMAKFPRSFKTSLSPRNWVSKKFMRSQFLEKELTDQVKLLDFGSSLSKTMSKKIRLMGERRRRIPRTYDPLVNKNRIRIPVPQTFLLADELSLTRWEWSKFQAGKKIENAKDTIKRNGFKDWISGKNRKWSRGDKNPMPWDTLPSRSKRIFHFIFKNRVLYDYEVQDILKKIRSLPKLDVTWKEITNLDYEDQILFLTYLEVGRCHRFGWISPFKTFPVKNFERVLSVKKKIRRLHKIEDLSTDLARTIALYFDNDFDVPGEDGDFRHRKLRNVGITFAKGKPRSERLVQRYANVSDFRRRFFKGSMRSRRRKTLLWKALQEKIRSPFFLRSAERPNLFQLLIERLTTPSLEAQFAEFQEKADYESHEKLLDISPSARKSLIGESRLARSAIAARSDIGPIHNGRGYMLVFQSRFRKFLKLPVLIVMKNIGRILLRQNPEWKKDWTKWGKEIHINCTFDGEEFSQDELPPRWLREGIQIKIVYPFRLKPWHTDRSVKPHILLGGHGEAGYKSRKPKSEKKLKRKRQKFTYLTVLGYQTDIPFGAIQKETSFWKPVRRKVIWICMKSLPRQIKHAYQIISSKVELKKVLKPSSSPSEELKSLSNLRPSGDLPNGFFSSDNRNYMKTASTNYVDKLANYDYDVTTKSDKSIAIGGEINPASVTGKQLVARSQVGREQIFKNIVAAESANPLDEKIETDDTYFKMTSENLLPVDPALSDTKIVNSAKFEWKQLVHSEEAVLSLHLIGEELVETFVSVVINLFLTIDRISVHYFNEFVALFMQLARVLGDINIRRTSNLFTRTKLPRLGSPSQACLYADIWNTGMKENLDLELLLSGRKNNSDCGVTSRQGGIWSDSHNVSNLHQPEMYVKDTFVRYKFITTGLPNPEKEGHRVNQFISCFYEDTSNIAKEFFYENVAKSMEKWGFSNKFFNLDENNWNEWLDDLSKYNFPSSSWCSMAPWKWRVRLSELNISETNNLNELRPHVFQNKLQIYSIYTKKYLFRDRIKNFNKLRKYRNLLHNLIDFMQNEDVNKLSVQQNVLQRRFCRKSCIRRNGGGSNILKLIYFRNSQVREGYNSNLQIDLLSRLDLHIAKQRTFYNFSKKMRWSKEDLILKDNDQCDLVVDISSKFQKVLDELYEIMLEEREDADYIFQWKWRFEAELEKFRNLIALTRTLGDDQDLITLCTNIEVNSDLLNLYFNATTKFDLFHNLSVISAHRLPLVFDDQDLLYKILNPLLRFKLRSGAGRRFYKNVCNDSYVSNVSHILIERNCKQSRLYNIDDLLSPRRRREFRFLRCLLFPGNSGPKIDSSHFILEIGKTCNIDGQHLPEPGGIQKIRRFLWSSHRLEEIACTGRFCLGATTGSRFAMTRIRMYPIITS